MEHHMDAAAATALMYQGHAPESSGGVEIELSKQEMIDVKKRKRPTGERDLFGAAATEKTCDCETKFRKLLNQLQKDWLEDYQAERERALALLTQKMEEQFREETSALYKADLEEMKKQFDQQLEARVREEKQAIQERHKNQLSDAKKKQWCWTCENEAIYHCCWNTAYCSPACQEKHWPQHRRNCKRRKQTQGAGQGGSGGKA